MPGHAALSSQYNSECNKVKFGNSSLTEWLYAQTLREYSSDLQHTAGLQGAYSQVGDWNMYTND